MTRILAALLLSGCATVPGLSPTAEPSTGNQSDITVTFAAPHRINELCTKLAKQADTSARFFGYYRACAFVRNYYAPGRTACEIVTPEPKSFDDTETLALLGHEVWHCFGAQHIDATDTNVSK